MNRLTFHPELPVQAANPGLSLISPCNLRAVAANLRAGAPPVERALSLRLPSLSVDDHDAVNGTHTKSYININLDGGTPTHCN